MQALEFTRQKGIFGRSYTSAVVLAAESMPGLMAEFRLAKATLVEWAAKRGRSGTNVQLTLVVPPAMDPEVMSFLGQLPEEADLGPILRKRSVHVSIVDERGAPRREYDLPR